MSLSRRELLSLLVGVPAAASCRPRQRDVPGAIIGGSLGIGHRVRDAHLEQARGEPRRVGTAIVGAGPSGLAAAWRLERMGLRDFVVFELEAQPGGTSTFGTRGVVPYPWAAHYVPVPGPDDRALIALLDEMGVLEAGPEGAPRAGKERHLVREPEERVYYAGRWHEGLFPLGLASDQDRAELGRFERQVERWIGWRDARGRPAFALPLARCSDAAELVEIDRISAHTWLEERGIRSPLVRWYVEYACRDDYGTKLETTSAWAMLFYYASRTPRPGAPSAPFLTWPEGNGRIVRHLERVLGGRLETGKLVTDVWPRDTEVELAIHDVPSGTLTRVVAERAVLAVPRFVARRILRPWRERAPAWLDGVSYSPWLVGNLHLRDRPASRGFGPAWDNVIYDSASLGYVVATHQTFRDRGPTIFTWYQPLVDPDPRPARAKLEALNHAACVDLALADLGPSHPKLEELVERADFWRWGHAMVRPTPGLIRGPGRLRAAEPVGRVHQAHSDLSGVALLEEAVDHGVRAAEEVAAARGLTFASLRG